jgi:hypothetical protein
MGEPRDQIGEEVHRLMSAVQDWARRAIAEPAAGHAGGPGAATECLPWCPICQFASVLRGEHPEITERLTEAGAALATAVKSIADATLTRAQPAPADAEEPTRPRPSPRVQRIHLDDPDQA